MCCNSHVNIPNEKYLILGARAHSMLSVEKMCNNNNNNNNFIYRALFIPVADQSALETGDSFAVVARKC